LRFGRHFGLMSPPPLTDYRLRYIEGISKNYALLIIAADIAIIILAGRWNTSDADHYLGFRNLRSRGKRQASSPQLRVSACRP
jgi:hypothetical protein